MQSSSCSFETAGTQCYKAEVLEVIELSLISNRWRSDRFPLYKHSSYKFYVYKGVESEFF